MVTGPDVGARAVAALGGTDAQLRPHALGNLKVGTTKTTQVAALIRCFP
jgi:hypothetical protein